jgi:hypothetical protein
MKKIAFCVPILNRLSDLQSTLISNLECIQPYKHLCNLYINCFDDNDEVTSWIDKFVDKSLTEGVLSVTKLTPLKSWHFSIAKNSFKSIIKEEYYSSLDGDNFITPTEVENLLYLINKDDDDYLIHGFSGVWGDGSCGRITLPSHFYREIGYLENIYPRQFDEVGLILKLLSAYPSMTFVCQGKYSLLEKSGNCLKFLERNNISPKIISLQVEKLDFPLNAKNSNYKNQDFLLRFYSNFNINFTLADISRCPKARAIYEQTLHKLPAEIDFELSKSLLPYTFEYKKQPFISNCNTMYAVIKDDHHFLNEWISHYRSLGIRRFIIVDDNSEPPLDKYLEGEDIFIFKPLVGNFKLCKTFWLKFLMNYYQAEGSWVLTCDSDEFLEIDKKYHGIDNYLKHLDSIRKDFVAAILIDMLPKSAFEDKLDISKCLSLQDFTVFDINESLQINNYQSHNCVSWGFGKFWKYSFIFDIRWKLFKSYDSLRKIPLFKHYKYIELNQGFHSLAINSTTLRSDELFANPNYILPIRHYKFLTLLSSARATKSFDNYFSRTASNYRFISSLTPAQILNLIRTKSNPVKFSFDAFKNKLPKMVGFYRIIGNNLAGLHYSDQSINNLRYIIERESAYNGNVQKVFILNRITSQYHNSQLKKLINDSGNECIEIAFDTTAYDLISYDIDNLPDYKYWLQNLSLWERLSAFAALRESKNKYAINNNGARSFALQNGRSRFPITFPWDGNCFLPDIHYSEIVSKFCIKNVDCVVVPMERALDNLHISHESVCTNPKDEPQIAFSSLSTIDFNIDLPYGNQPKVELLKRLGCPGIWDKWTKKYPWKEFVYEVENNVNYNEAGAVYRLASGNTGSTTDSDIRARTRIQGICEYLDTLTSNTIAKNFASPNRSRMLLLCVVSYIKAIPELLHCFDATKAENMLCDLNAKHFNSKHLALELSQYFLSLKHVFVDQRNATGFTLSISLLRLVAVPDKQKISDYEDSFNRVISLHNDTFRDHAEALHSIIVEFSIILSKFDLKSAVLFHIEVFQYLRFCISEETAFSQSMINLILFFSDVSSIIFDCNLNHLLPPISRSFFKASYKKLSTLHGNSIVKAAQQAFTKNELLEALYLYEVCSLVYGGNFFEANIHDIKKRLNANAR